MRCGQDTFTWACSPAFGLALSNGVLLGSEVPLAWPITDQPDATSLRSVAYYRATVTQASGPRSGAESAAQLLGALPDPGQAEAAAAAPGGLTRAIGENKQGNITYTVVATPRQQDERLRWNMAASVTIEAQ